MVIAFKINVVCVRKTGWEKYHCRKFCIFAKGKKFFSCDEKAV